MKKTQITTILVSTCAMLLSGCGGSGSTSSSSTIQPSTTSEDTSVSKDTSHQTIPTYTDPTTSVPWSQDEGYTYVGYKPTERDRYDNIFRDNLPDQWENYGIGDPYVLRWNGKYYLFPSTKDWNEGYKVWESEDLVHFKYLGHHGIYNKDGSVFTGATEGVDYTKNGTEYIFKSGVKISNTQLGQFAPEIYYWNGDFYMYGSPSGNGHYVYKSNNGTPWGDYYAITDNIGHSIDGSVFIDDDESMYFYTAGNGAIQAYQMTDITNIKSRGSSLSNVSLVKWTEGPCVVKHNGTYFITYTGNHVKSTGYRVGYSYSNTSPINGYVAPVDHQFLIDTNEGWNGFGHSSTCLGPNLDSRYISFHSLDDASGPIRSYNIHRLSFTDNRMTVVGPNLKGTEVPMLPDFVAYEGDDVKMTTTTGVTLSNANTDSRFSVEYNFKGIQTDGSAKLYFSETGSKNNYVTIKNNQIILTVGGTEIATGTLKNTFDFTKLHTILVRHEYGRYQVMFDNMCKIDVKGQQPVSGGKVGYEGVSEIGTTTFSNDAFDSSDRKEAKLVSGNFFAANYLEYDSRLTSSSYRYQIPSLDENKDGYDDDVYNIYTKSSAMHLGAKKDYLLYTIDAKEESLYGIEAMFSFASKGSVISLQVDNEKPQLVTLSDLDTSSNPETSDKYLKFSKQFIAEKYIKKGLHTFKFELVSGQVDVSMFNFFKATQYKMNYQHNLDSYVETGANYLTLWKINEINGTLAHRAKTGSNNMVLFGTENMTNYEVSVDIYVTVCSGTGALAGIITRCLNPALYTYQVDECAQGYLTAFNDHYLVQKRIDWKEGPSNVSTKELDTSRNKWHNLRVVCKGNYIDTYFDGTYVFSYADPFPFSHGYVALYSINAESYFKNLTIKGI